jgi:hypothetical protein
MKVTHLLASLGRLGILLMPFLAAGQSFHFGGFEVVSSRRVGRTEFEYVLRVAITNRVAPASGVRALAFSTSTNTFVTDNAVEFGDLNLGASATSTDTFTVRHNREVPFDPSVLQWFPSARSMPFQSWSMRPSRECSPMAPTFWSAVPSDPRLRRSWWGGLRRR